jgi:hypothetical protein
MSNAMEVDDTDMPPLESLAGGDMVAKQEEEEKANLEFSSNSADLKNDNSALEDHKPADLIFVTKRDPRRKDIRFHGRLRVVDPCKRVSKAKKKENTPIKADPEQIDASDELITNVEPALDTSRPTPGMSREQCSFLIQSTIDEILQGHIRAIIVPKHLNWRIALDRCTAILLSPRESDEALARVNISEDLNDSRDHLTQFFVRGFNDWYNSLIVM